MQNDIPILCEFVSTLYDINAGHVESNLSYFCYRDNAAFVLWNFECLEAGDLVIVCNFDEDDGLVELNRLEFWSVVKKLGDEFYCVRRTILLDGKLNNNLDRVRGMVGAEFSETN